MGRLHPCGYGEMIQVNDCVSIRFTDVGHLLGSSAIEIWSHENGEERKITFSGDIGNKNQPILKDPQACEGHGVSGHRVHLRRQVARR